MLPFTPDIGIVLLTISTLLIFFELNRPGLILPGALGLLGVLLTVSSLRQWHLSWTSLLFLLAGSAPCFWQLRHNLAPAWAWLSAAFIALGFARLVDSPAPAPVHWLVAILCGITLGTGASLLAGIAHRARQNKGLN